MKYDLHIYEKHLLYLPSILVKLLGKDSNNVDAIANCVAVVLFNEDTDLEEVIESLEVIKMDLRQRIRVNKKQLVTA